MAEVVDALLDLGGAARGDTVCDHVAHRRGVRAASPDLRQALAALVLRHQVATTRSGIPALVCVSDNVWSLAVDLIAFLSARRADASVHP